jgi:hypothetical protein
MWWAPCLRPGDVALVLVFGFGMLAFAARADCDQLILADVAAADVSPAARAPVACTRRRGERHGTRARRAFIRVQS